MLSIARSKLSYKNIMLSHQTIYTGRPHLLSDKAFQKLKLKQAKMQREDNLPVYLKCGLRDKVIFWIVSIFVMYNTINSIRVVKQLLKEY